MAAEVIPFNVPGAAGREMEHVAAAVASGHLAGGGAYSERVGALLTDELGVAGVVPTTSCTAALELAALAAGIGPGDVVIVPSFTFVTTALAFARTGARLRFADIDPVTLGLDAESVASLMSPEVAAVVPVHYGGIPCDLGGLQEVIAGTPASLVEDNAHGLFGTSAGRPLGSFGRFSAVSFHDTKSFVCGEGGALAVRDAADLDRVQVLLDKGTNRRSFLDGLVDRYTWVDTGSSFALGELGAAYLWGQLEARDVILRERRRIAERYHALLAPHADELGFRTMPVPEAPGSAHAMYYVLLEDRQRRDAVLAHLRSAGVEAAFHYVPLHDAPGAKPHLDVETACPVTTDVSGRLLRLPFFNDLTDDDVDRVIETFLTAVRG